MKVVLFAVMMILLVSVASAATVNVTGKQLVIAGETPNFYGVITTNTSDVYVTGYPTSLGKTLDLLNSIDISSNVSGTWVFTSIAATNGIIT